jgi:hypothetical protein
MFGAASSQSAPHSRIAALAQEEGISTPPSHPSDRSGGTFLSPTDWTLIGHPDDSFDMDTPTNQGKKTEFLRNEPSSPLEENFRTVSTTSTSTNTSRGLPSRPGIPSPLASTLLTKSTSARTPSRSGLPRPTSRATNLADASRPLSPSMIPQPTHTHLRALSPTSSTSNSRPTSRTAHRAIGRGPPPSAHHYPNTTHQPLALSVSTSTPNSLRRSTRRSSLGVAEHQLPPTGIPAPVTQRARGPGTPTRPVSVPVFTGNTPPPVPRIPSAHLKESVRRHGLMGASQRDRAERPSQWKG